MNMVKLALLNKLGRDVDEAKEIKTYTVESLQEDYENALINEVILQFLREHNDKSYVGRYTIKRIDFLCCEAIKGGNR